VLEAILLKERIRKRNSLTFGIDEKKHVIVIPSFVIVGDEILDHVLTVVESLSVDSALVVTGPRTYEIAGRYVLDSLNDACIENKILIVHEASKKYAQKGIDLFNEFEFEAVIGIGGGKNLDVSKVIAKETRAFFISVPTNAAHDGIASPVAALKERKGRYSAVAVPPIAVIADIDIIKKAPKRFLNAGVSDLVANLNAVEDWKLAHEVKGEYYGSYAAHLSKASAEFIINLADDIKEKNTEGIRGLIESLISSGMAMGIAGSSRPASGAEHLFSHALDQIASKPALHGEQCGVGTILMLYYRGDPRWKEIREFLKYIGAPTTAKELGVTKEEVVKALTIAHTIRPERYTILGEKGLTISEAKKIAKETGVI